MSLQDLDALISGHFDQALDAAERAELDRRLRSDPAAARRFAGHARLHAALRLRAQDQAAVRNTDPEAPVPRLRPKRAPRHPAGVRPWWPTLAMAATLLLAVGGSWWWLGRQDPALAWIESAVGTVSVGGANAREIAAQQQVLTAGDSSASIRLGDGSQLELEAESALRIARAQGRWELALERGAVSCQVSPQPSDAGFVLRTPQAAVSVLGTRFRVEHRASRSSVSVSEGQVELSAGGATRLLAAGNAAVVSAGLILDPPEAAAPAREAILWRADLDSPLGAAWIAGERVDSDRLPSGSASPHGIRAEVIQAKDGGQLLQLAIKQPEQPLFTIGSEPVTIRLRYWAGSQTRWLGVWLATAPWQGYQHFHREFTPVHGRWVTTEIPLQDLLNDGSGQPPATGERVVHLMVQGEYRPGAELYVDELTVLER